MAYPRFYISFLFLFFQTWTLAQQIPFKNYTVQDGYNLPSNEFYDIVQDKQGYIWLGTTEGLVKFDGYNFQTYNTRTGLVFNQISSLLIDKTGKLWIGTDNGGISVFNGKSFTSITSDNGLASNSVRKLLEDKSGNIWMLGFGSGLSIIKKDTIMSFTEHNSIIKSQVNCCLFDKKGNIYLGNSDGLYLFDGELKHIDTPLMEDCKLIWDMSLDEYGRLWIGTEENGVFCYSPDTVLNYTTRDGLSSDVILSVMNSTDNKTYIGTWNGGINVIENSMVTDVYSDKNFCAIWELFEDRNGRIWGNTRGEGLYLIENGKLEHFTKENLLIDNNVNKIFEDSNKNIWFGTQNGLSKLGKNIFNIYNQGFIGNDKKVFSVYAGPKGKIYAGTYSGLNYFCNEGNVVKNVSAKFLPTDPSVYSITGDRLSNLWLGTVDGITLLNKTSTHFSILDYDTSGAINEDYYSYGMVEHNGAVYSATNQGLLVFNDKKYRLYTTNDGLLSNDVNCVSVDKQENIWCGTLGGLSILSDGIFHNYTVFNGLSDNCCNDIAFDSSGVAWIATKYGLTCAVLEKNYNLSTRKYFVSNGFGSNIALSVLIDNLQQVWVGHNRGVDCFNPVTKEVKIFSNLDGFMPVENCIGAVTIDCNYNIWFGTIDGLVKYIPENEIKNTLPPKIYITGVHLYNDSASLKNYYSKTDSITNLPSDLKLKHKKRNLYFTYVGLHYTVVEKNKYKYRLLGYDDEWSQATNEIVSVPFQRIPPGHYVFQVMAANCDGVWNEQPAEFVFQILPPLWQTWWARILEVLILFALFYLIMYLRVRKLRRDKMVLTQKVAERTAEIEKQKSQIEIQRDQISLQKQEITDSIEYAKHIQSAILPKDDTIAPLLKNYFILYKPRDIVSGDFFWINNYGDKVIAIAADCTGHGVPGAFMSMLGVSALNEITANNAGLSAGEILDLLREHVISTLSHTKSGDEARDGMDLSMCIFDYKKQKAWFAGAFNPLVLIRNKEEFVFKADKMPVGLHSGDVQPFTTNEIDLQAGDCLYMFSDGYADQFGGPDGKKFKSVKFRSLLCEISDKTMANQRETLDETIEKWMEGHEQIDDILVMGIKV